MIGYPIKYNLNENEYIQEVYLGYYVFVPGSPRENKVYFMSGWNTPKGSCAIHFGIDVKFGKPILINPDITEQSDQFFYDVIYKRLKTFLIDIRLPLQIYPDKSVSDSYIEYDPKTLKVTKVNYVEPELKLKFKVGDTLTKKWLSNFTAK